MVSKTLGMIICPMLEDEALHSIKNDDDKKHVFLINNEYNISILEKMKKSMVDCTVIDQSELENNEIDFPEGYNILIKMNDLALHKEPKDLKKYIEEDVRWIQPYVDSIAIYYGLCGNYGWDITMWAKENNLKPTEVMRDIEGKVCDDCVGVAVGGGKRYLELETTYKGMFYATPAISHNWKTFIMAGDSAKELASMSKEVLDYFGITDEDSYMRWLLEIGHYKHVLKMDTGLGDRGQFDRDFDALSKRLSLEPIIIGNGWITLQPAEDLYLHAKDNLNTH